MSDDQYARSVAKVIAGQVLDAEGVDGVQKSAVDILADLLLRYIQEVGKKSHLYAEVAHRSEVNPLDVKLALQDMNVSLEELEKYAASIDESSFAQNISAFPVLKPAPPVPTFTSCNETPPSHIPSFLPAFPDPHCRLDTPEYHKADQTPAKRQKEIAKQQLEGEKALLKLKAREEPESDLLQTAAAAAQTEIQATIEPLKPNPFLDAPITEENSALWTSVPLPRIVSAATTARGIDIPHSLPLLDNRQLQAPAQIKAMQQKLEASTKATSFGACAKPVDDAYSKEGGGAGGENRVRAILSSRTEEGPADQIGHAMDESIDEEMI